MLPSNLHDAARMTPEQRLAEAAALLAVALHRLRSGAESGVSPVPPRGLDFIAEASVHGDPALRSPLP